MTLKGQLTALRMALVTAIALSAQCALAQSDAPPGDDAPSVTLFQNVRIFDGKTAELSEPSHVLVRGDKIERISTSPIPANRSGRTKIINGEGRTLMPGLIDAHWHAMLVRPTPAQAMAADVGYTNLVASAEAKYTLLRGFTTVRDLGGPAFGLKRAIDEGLVPGPRIFPAGAMITITSGHGDFRQPTKSRAFPAAP
jgi:imidazolonepropionase-like amidohydrolase